MFEIRIHGRGSQGVVTAAELLSVAAFLDGYEAQAFPSFGSERMGAPVVSFCRISERPIRAREPVSEPDALIVVDRTLLQQIDVFAGLRTDGYVVINSSKTIEGLGLGELAERHDPDHLLTIPATVLAREHIGRPLPNVCLLGAFAALTGRVSLASLETAVLERFPKTIADANVAAARAAYDTVQAVSHA